MEHKRFGLFRRLLIPVVLFVILAIGVVRAQAIADYIRLYHYQPPAAVAKLADDTTMSAEGRHLFYVNHPLISDRQAFNIECRNDDEKTIVLGCYKAHDQGIFLFNVNDARLNGVEQVTAAHEMLHAAYARLGSEQRQTVDAELQQFYKNDVHDARLRATIAAYQRTEPNDVVNEMHSVFGTEIKDLPPGLESYYAQYFTNRKKIADYAAAYENEFTSRQQRVQQYDTQLTALKQQIDANTAELKQDEATINAKRSELESEKASDDYADYNAAVPDFNNLVQQYNTLLGQTQASVASYNQLVQQRNAIAAEFTSLTKSIDSQLTPIGQ